MPHIAIAGFQHETNSFGAGQAGLDEFVMDDSWPGLRTGKDVETATFGLNLPIAGAIAAAKSAPNVTYTPILWASAEPSGPVTDEAFETIASKILEGISQLDKIDGLYLDLHGAMITMSHDDGEGELLRRIRNLVGFDLPIAVSLDLHANITQAFVDLVTSVAIFRTYPHLDMAETGTRALTHLLVHVNGHKPAKSFRQVPFIIPMHAQYTGSGAMKRLYDSARDLSTNGVHVELAAGFTASDIADNGPSIVALAQTQDAADTAADMLFAKVIAAEADFDCALLNVSDAVEQACAMPKGRPVILADVQDNPGGGTSSDTTGLLRGLVEQGADAVLGLMHDPAAASMAHRVGVGGSIEVGLGGKSGIADDTPLEAKFLVEALTDGRVTYEGEMYGGGIAQIGPTALLRIADSRVRVVVSSVRNQCLDRGYFRHIGIDPETQSILAVKSTVHYRADFEPISQAVISVASPGSLQCDIQQIPFRKLREGQRLGPNGPPFRPAKFGE